MAGFNRQGDRLPAVRPGTHQNVSYSTTTRTGSDFGSGIELIRIVATSDCHYKLGDGTVTATTSDPFLPAGAIEFVRINEGVDTRIAVVQSSASGTLSVAECN